MEQKLDPHVLQAVADIASLMDEALRHFSNSYAAHIATANFHGFITCNRHLEAVHLAHAEATNPPLDVAVWIYLRRQQNKLDITRNTSSTASITSRVEFDAQFQKAEEHSLDARNDIVSESN